jgi:flagellar hook-length control protein FliK
MEISMDARTDFLTAPAPSPRGNDALAGSASGDISPSGAQFAGVLNGQMLKLERQALASSGKESADLQVLRLGNKLNVITTDSPLPDVASLADFARAQGLGESAVQALFGATAHSGTGLSQALSINIGNPSAPFISAAELVTSGDLQAAMALAMASAKDTSQVSASQTALTLAQASANDLLQVAASQDGMKAIAGQSWLSLRAQSAAAAAISISADTAAKKILDRESAALAGSADVQVPVPAAPELGVNLMNVPAQIPAGAPTQLSTLLDAQNVGAPTAQLLADRALLANRIHQPAVLDAAATLAAAVQAGLGLVPMQQPTALEESAVTVTSLSIEKSGSNKAADLVETGAVALAAAKALLQMNATTGAAPVEEEAQAPSQPQADLQIRLLPPDQAITQRLAQMAGKSKSIDWSALLAGQKVSDTLAGLAQSPAPALSDAQAKLVAQMQANGQLPASGDEARNALLAKLQAQAASVGAAPAAITASAGNQGAPSLGKPPTVTGVAQITSQTAGAANLLPTDNKALATQSTLALQTSGAAAALQPVHSSSLWESVRIEVPSGLVLEALQEHQAQKSDAEPTLPASATTGASTSVAHSPAADKAPAASPQALADQRAAHYQQVADQLGEAMAKRLMAQIERGQWKMQLRMQPAALGRIDVELDMHAKGLDATFTSDNAVTRELMAQGSARLRDTLTQTGTTVASVVVNGDSGRQSGGNSTPGQKPKGEQNANNKKGVTPALVQTAAMPPAAQGDGLNVLA